MKYLAFILKLVIILIGVYMMYKFPEISKPPFISGTAIVLIGTYLVLEGYFGRSFSTCIFKKVEKIEKKKGFFG